jgi:ubiquinone/menaquinone biosynthesis C-methylase UbiE
MILSKYYQRYWQRSLDSQSHHTPPTWDEDNLNYHVKFFQPYIGYNLLDLGCGDGTFLNRLTQQFNPHSSIGVDLVKPKNKINFSFFQSSAESVRLPPSSVDTVFLVEVIEHILDVDSLLDNIHRTLKVGGHLCITTTDFNLLKKIIIATFYWNKFFYPNTPHIRFFTHQTLVDICQKHRFIETSYQWNKSYFGLMPKGQMIVFQKS